MEPANVGVVLDSSIVIEAERERLDVVRFLKRIASRIGEQGSVPVLNQRGRARARCPSR